MTKFGCASSHISPHIKESAGAEYAPSTSVHRVKHVSKLLEMNISIDTGSIFKSKMCASPMVQWLRRCIFYKVTLKSLTGVAITLIQPGVPVVILESKAAITPYQL